MRRTIHRAIASSTAAGLALVLTACGSSGGGDDQAAGGSSSGGGSSDSAIDCDETQGAVVGYSEPLPDPNFQFIEQIIERQLEEHGATLRAVNANLDPGKQVSDINTLVQSGISVLIANPIDPNATKPAFDRARQQNIPIVAQETTVGGPFVMNVTSDVEGAAQQGVQLLKDTVGDGQVTAVLGPSFAEILSRENDAFTAAAESAGLDVVDTQVNQQITPQAAQGFAASWRDKYAADLKGIWTFNDTSAVGAASAFQGQGPAIVSINGEPQVIPLIQSGAVLATYDIQQDKIGQVLAYGALAAICGSDVPEEVVIPVQQIDKDNVGDYRPLKDRVDDPFDVRFEERDSRTYLAG